MDTKNNQEVEITKKTKTNIWIVTLALTFGSLSSSVTLSGPKDSIAELLGYICGGLVMWYFILYGLVYACKWFKVQYSD